MPLVALAAAGLAVGPASVAVRAAPRLPFTALTAVAFTSPRAGDTSQVQFFSRSAGIVLGIDQNAGQTPAIWHTSDGGARWTEDLSVIR
jgi:hypothetical protein